MLAWPVAFVSLMRIVSIFTGPLPRARVIVDDDRLRISHVRHQEEGG